MRGDVAPHARRYWSGYVCSMTVETYPEDGAPISRRRQARFLRSGLGRASGNPTNALRVSRLSDTPDLESMSFHGRC